MLLAPALTRANDSVQRQPLDGADLIVAEARLAIQADWLLSVLEQPCHVREWMPDLVEIRSLAPDPGPGQRVYMVTRGTLLSQPRDSVGRFVRDPDTPLQITMQAEPDALPPVSGRVRIPYAEARWSLFAEEATTLLHYQQRVAIGGQVPQWLADHYSQRYVARVLDSLKRYVATLSSPDCPARR